MKCYLNKYDKNAFKIDINIWTRYEGFNNIYVLILNSSVQRSFIKKKVQNCIKKLYQNFIQKLLMKIKLNAQS